MNRLLSLDLRAENLLQDNQMEKAQIHMPMVRPPLPFSSFFYFQPDLSPTFFSLSYAKRLTARLWG